MIKEKLFFLSKKTMADLVLLFFAMVWGLAFPLMHIAIRAIGPIDFLIIKYFFATLFFLPFVFLKTNEKRKKFLKLIPYGIILSLLYFCAAMFQAEGLQRIAAGRNAFITGLVVVIVPLLSPVFHGIYPKKFDVFAIVIVLFGMYLLLDPLHSQASWQGDLLSFIGTLFFAVHMQTLQKFSKKYDEPIIFAFYQMLFITLFSLTLASFLDFRANILVATHMSLYILFILMALGLLVMSAFFIQAKFQPMTTPSRAVLIYNLQPAIAAFFAFFILNEKMSYQSILGGGITILAVVTAKLYRIYKEGAPQSISGT